MKELKKFSVALAIAVLVALFFVVIWAHNTLSDHTNKINTLWMATGSTAAILEQNKKEQEEIQKSILDLGQGLKNGTRNKNTNFTNIFEALKSMEGAIKKSNEGYSLPSSAHFVTENKKKKKKHHKYSSESEDYSSSDLTDSEVEAELQRRKKRKGGK